MGQDNNAHIRPLRPPQDNIGQTKEQRQKLLQTVIDYVRREKPAAPLSLDELRKHSRAVLKAASLPPKYIDFTAILLNNEVWRPTVESIPYDKRLLLIPKCLRSRQCTAAFDEIGLLCEHCGRCLIDQFKSRAEQLGYAVLIAEGSPVVMSLIETGQVEAVIGVSCMSVLEQVFPYTEAAAIPGAAIPLLQDGCCDTTVDVDWVWDAIYRTADEDTGWLNLEQLKEQVQAWFTEDSLRIALQWRGGDTENLALAWLAKAGKRWRPFLAACAHQAVAPSTSESPGEDLRKAAVAVECFHKASLVHDDIEDGDNTRYGQKTLHAEHGIPIALNVGDFLLGEGYRLLTELNVSGDRIKKLVQAAVKGHRDLCIGQGDELAWLKKPKQLTVDQVINIFQKKTSAAFEVALSLGVTLAGGSDELGVPLEQYSRSLGIAYQIRDDIDDFGSCENLAAEIGSRPSLLLALACEMAEDKDKKLLESVWSGRGLREDEEQDIRDIFEKLQVEQAALNLMQFHKSQAIGSLAPLKSTALKALLRRVIAKIFNDLDVMRCCNDHPARHEKGSSEGEASAG